MISLRSRTTVALAAGALALGGAGTALGFGGGFGLFGGGPSGDPAGDLAAAINKQAGTSITGAQVQAAMLDLLKTRLDKAVQDGRLTQAQADRMLQFARSEPQRRAQAEARRAKAIAPVAKLLGTTPEAIQNGIENGSSLAEQAQKKGVSRADLLAAITAGLKDAGVTADAQELAEIAARIADAQPGMGFRAFGRHRIGGLPPFGLPPVGRPFGP
jgi:hypothetical protein